MWPPYPKSCSPLLYTECEHSRSRSAHVLEKIHTHF